MNYKRPKWLRVGVLGVFFVIFMVVVTGCATVKTDKKPDQKPGQKIDKKTTAPPELKRIVSMHTEEDSESVAIIVKGSRLLTYTSVKQLFPLSVVLYFPRTALGPVKTLPSGGDVVSAVTATELTEKGHTTRIEISLQKDVPYDVSRVASGLKIAFRKIPEAAKPKPVEPEKGSLAPDIKSDIKADIKPQKEPAEPAPLAKPTPPGPVLKPEAEKPTETPAQPPTWVNRIDFLSEDAGKSTIIIGTTEAVAYEIKKATDKRVLLRLFNTKLPSYRQRPLITTRFESAVDRIIPGQPDTMQNLSIIAIELREQVPYFVEQNDNLILVHFEASSIPPKPFEEAKLPSWKKVFSEVAAESRIKMKPGEKPGEKPDKEATEGIEAKPQKAAEPAEKARRYTGEKIALDFFNTDIKNVFRILMEVSGKNFAIDKDVSGRVTLTLDKPVPWDQVLDLILRMNKLGQIQEGDIVRIATLNTLKSEQKLEEEQIDSEKKAVDQKLALEPLVQEFIPVNYAKATSDILPHLKEIITEKRGIVSVDQRTNLILINDTAEKIKLAKELVRRLDRVTPQVLIEARIVEANTSFARNFGIEWGAAGGIQQGDSNAGVGPQRSYDILGGTYGYDLAINLPQASTGILGFNFTRLSGTPLMLNAQLQALETRGEGRIISAPKILTLDNKQATIKQGVEFPFQTVKEGEVSIEFKSIDLTLSVTPQITSDDRIAIQIDIQKNDVFTQTAEGPALTTKNAKTELLINDGETVVIGGIIKTTDTMDNQGLPGLSHIPIIGWLFKSKALTQGKEELLIFLTPKIVRLKQRGV